MLDNIKQSTDKPLNLTEAFILELVNSQLHTTHGHKLLTIWNLPEQYCIIARDHHAEAADKDNVLLTAVQVGDKTCNNLGIGLRTEPTLSVVATEHAQLLGLSEIDLAKLEIKLEDSKMLAA
jgi:HD-like signal output (HDOD) protein